MPKLGCINTIQAPRLSAGIETVRSVLNTMLLIADCCEFPGVAPFVTNTHAALDDDARQANKVFMIGLQYAAFPVADFPTFEAYLEDLGQTDPAVLQERVFHSYDLISAYKVGILSQDSPVTVTQKDQARLLSSKNIYLEYLNQSFGSEGLDYDIEGRAYDFLVDPKQMRDSMVEHFHYMWTRFLKEEFDRYQAILEKTTAELNAVNTSAIPPLEAAKRVTGHDIEQVWASRTWELDWIRTAPKVVFVPSLHMGPYLGRRLLKEAMYIFFGPRIAKGRQLSSPELTRTDIHTRLTTLSDDVRLQILKLLTRQPELSSKQVMDELSLTQSSASRHLKQLSATGFLNERRRHSAKIYSLNPSFISQTLEAVECYLKSE